MENFKQYFVERKQLLQSKAVLQDHRIYQTLFNEFE